MQHDKITQKHKHKQKNLGTVNGPSETKPNPENCKNCSSKCAYDCTTLVHNTAQSSSNHLPSYLKETIIAQMLSIEGKGGYGYLQQDYHHGRPANMY